MTRLQRTVDATHLVDVAQDDGRDATLADGHDGGPVTSVSAARDLGRRLAATIDRRYEGATPRALVDAFDLRLVRDDWAGIGGVQLLGTYSDGEITIYPRAIADRADALDVDSATLERCVLAHELGHYLLASVTFRSESSGLLRRIAPILSGRADGQRTLEEHAAAQFSTEVTGIRRPGPTGVAVSQPADTTPTPHSIND